MCIQQRDELDDFSGPPQPDAEYCAYCGNLIERCVCIGGEDDSDLGDAEQMEML